MQKIKSIYLYHLRKNEHFEFMRHIISIITDAGAEALNVVNQLAGLENALAREREVITRVTKSLLTTRIAEADLARETLYYGLASAIRAASRHYNIALRRVAEPLIMVIDSFGDVTRRAIEEETSVIVSLCNALTQHHAEACATLGLTEWINALEGANREVHKLIESRLEEGANRPKLTMSKVRAKVDAAYKTLADTVFACGLIASRNNDAELTAKYENVTGQWNELVERAGNILAARRGRAAARSVEN